MITKVKINSFEFSSQVVYFEWLCIFHGYENLDNFILIDYLYDRGYTITSDVDVGQEMPLSVMSIECPCIRHGFFYWVSVN